MMVGASLKIDGQMQRGDDLFPVVYRPSGTCDFDSTCHWLKAQHADFLNAAYRHGAILFRDFPLTTAEDFDRFVDAFGQPAFTYEDSLSNAVRIKRTSRVFTANEAPSSVQIFFHHEMAQTPLYPTRLFFFCEKPAETGGATPICRSDWLWSQLQHEEPEFTAGIKQHGLRYSNVMPGENDPNSGMGRSWQSTLKANTIAAAETRLGELRYKWEWLVDGCLRVTTPVLPGVMELSDGRCSFFNQLIAAYCGWKDVRNDPSTAITLGNGEKLNPRGVQAAIRIANELAYDIPWQTGDVALVDNYVVMHGRRPFTGVRKVLAAMI